MHAVRMPCWVDGTLIGLGEVMRCLGDRGSLHWRLFWAEFNGDVRAVWPQGTLAVEDQSREPAGVRLSWAEMVALTDTDVQVIDGDFVGFDDAGLPRSRILMVDSGHWWVWSVDPADYARVRETFVRVVTESHVPPEPAVD